MFDMSRDRLFSRMRRSLTILSVSSMLFLPFLADQGYDGTTAVDAHGSNGHPNVAAHHPEPIHLSPDVHVALRPRAVGESLEKWQMEIANAHRSYR